MFLYMYGTVCLIAREKSVKKTVYTQPLLKNTYENNRAMSREEARAVLERCLKVFKFLQRL